MKPERRMPSAADGPQAADGETRRQILDAAEGLFVARGFKGVSMKDVADAVRVTPAALYYHFPEGKEELFAETIRHIFRETAERAFVGLDASSGFRERLTTLTRNVLTLPVDRLAPLLRDAHEFLPRRDRNHDLMRDIALQFTEGLARVFREAAAAGEVTADIPPDLLAALHQGMCVALLNRRHFAPERIQPFDERRLAETLVSTLLDGIGRAPPQV